MDIYHTKKQTENIPRSCSYLLLKTLFYFISQCTSVPYFEGGLCKLEKKFVGPSGVYLLDFFCSGIQFNLLLSPYPCFISLLYLDLYVLGDDALIS